MQTRVVNIFHEPCDIYIGRAGKGKSGYFGNPFPLLSRETRGATIERFKKYFYDRIQTDIEFKNRVLEMEGKKLGCFCKQKNKDVPCHGDVYVEYLNSVKNDKL